MSGAEDLHAKISLSTFSLLFNAVEELATLPAEYQDDGKSSLLAQYTATFTSMTTRVSLRPLDAAEGTLSLTAQPAQSIVLQFQGLEQESDFASFPPDSEYAMTFGLSCEVGQSIGEFCFLDVPAGMYELVFDIDMVADAFTECGRRARERYLLESMRNQRSLQVPGTAAARAVIGPHVISLEKLDVLVSGKCSAISSNIVPFPLAN
jgi:hypothetical protein